jgi:hypothetical protein
MSKRTTKQTEFTRRADKAYAERQAETARVASKALLAGIRRGPVTDLGIYLKAETRDPAGQLARDWVAGHVRIAVAVGGKALAPLTYADTLEARAIESGELSVSEAIDRARPMACKAIENLRAKAAAVQADHDIDALAKSVGITLIERPTFTPEEIRRYEERLTFLKADARLGNRSWAEVYDVEAAGPQREVNAPAMDARLVDVVAKKNTGHASAADVQKVKATIAAEKGTRPGRA